MEGRGEGMCMERLKMGGEGRGRVERREREREREERRKGGERGKERERNDCFMSLQVSEEEQHQRTEVPCVPPDALSKKTGLLTEEVRYLHLCVCSDASF